MSIIQTLHALLNERQAIPFAEFMQLALYAPGKGYYSSGLQKLGKHGDFITAPELTPLFGKTLANQCQQVLRELESPIVFEFGAGSGALCVAFTASSTRTYSAENPSFGPSGYLA
jgi:SAM-dependent MidA family methyltransferase